MIRKAAGGLALVVLLGAMFSVGEDNSTVVPIVAPAGGEGGLASILSAGADSILGGDDSAQAAPADTTTATTGQVCVPASSTLPPPGTNRKVSRTRDITKPSPEFKRLYAAAAKKYGIPAELLTAVGDIETQHWATSMRNPSTAGARGPMQFMPGTWASYGVDGDGDGKKDILNPADAIPAAAAYLKASGAPGDVRKALYSYNRADWYVNDVLWFAQRHAAQPCTSTGAIPATTAPPVGGGAKAAKAAYPNGRFPDTALRPLATAKRHRLWPAAAAAYDDMSRAYQRDNGKPLCITDSYRSYAAQVSVKARKPRLAAKPGTSNHGYGLAVDLCGGVESFGTPQHEWMRANAARFGFIHPPWAQRGGSKPEPWHWEYSN